MAGLTDWPFRRLALSFGAGLTVTEMVSSVALSFGGAKTLKLLKTDPALEKPFCVQLFGKDPDKLALGAKMAVDMGADIIDLNFGCPARKVVTSGHGAAILKDFSLAETLVKKTVQAVSVPVTVKTRPAWAPGWPDIFELAPRLADAGAAAITLHGRTASQAFSGEADWGLVKKLVQTVPIPVFGSGDLTTAEIALERLKQSGAAGVLIGRGARGRPWIFNECRDLWLGKIPPKVTLAARLEVAVRHARWLEAEIGPKAAFRLRSVLMWYTKELPGAAAVRAAICTEEQVEKQILILTEAFSAAGQDI
jgi:tRNA-dihydrouridine synthase B